MHDPGTVDVPQSLGEPGHHLAQLGMPQRAMLLHMLGEGEAGNEQRGHPRPFGIGIGIHDGRGESAAHPSCGRDLLPEASPELGVPGELGMHDLHCELHSRGGPRQMYDAHAAGTQTPFKAVMAERTQEVPLPRRARRCGLAACPPPWLSSVSAPRAAVRTSDARSLVDDSYETDEAC